MALIVYTFLLSNIGHCQRGEKGEVSIYGMRQE